MSIFVGAGLSGSGNGRTPALTQTGTRTSCRAAHPNPTLSGRGNPNLKVQKEKGKAHFSVEWHFIQLVYDLLQFGLMEFLNLCVPGSDFPYFLSLIFLLLNNFTKGTRHLPHRAVLSHHAQLSRIDKYFALCFRLNYSKHAFRTCVTTEIKKICMSRNKCSTQCCGSGSEIWCLFDP